MARNLQESDRSGVSCKIIFDGLMTLELQGNVVVEIIKSLIYQRGHIPLPYDHLNSYVKSKLIKPCQVNSTHVFKDDNDAKSGNHLESDVTTSTCKIEPNLELASQKLIPNIDGNFRKICQSHKLLSNLFEHLNVVIGNNFKSTEVLLLIGGTQISPHELFHIILPELSEPACSTHSLPKLTLKSCMVRIFRQVVTNNIFWDSCSSFNVIPSSNIMVLVKMNRNVTMGEHMEPQLNFKMPSKASKLIEIPIILGCPECQSDASDIKSLEDPLNKLSINSFEANTNSELIWVKILPIAKGFPNSLLEK